MATPPGFIPHEKKYSLIRITSYRDKNLCGFVANSVLQQERYFSSLTQLLLILEEVMDTLLYPQRGTQDRVFQPASGAKNEPSPPQGAGKVLATFQLQILFRQNASWQGSLLWLDRSLEAQFRSVLELIHLLDSALQSREEQE